MLQYMLRVMPLDRASACTDTPLLQRLRYAGVSRVGAGRRQTCFQPAGFGAFRSKQLQQYPGLFVAEGTWCLLAAGKPTRG